MFFSIVKKGIGIALATMLVLSSLVYVPILANDAPASAASNEVVVKDSGTWFETAFATWTGSTDADYKVYVRGENIVDWRDGSQIKDFLTDWSLVNDEANQLLVRVVDKARGTWRVDIPGLPKGKYEIQIRNSDGKVLETFSNLKTRSFPRNGAAFVPSNKNEFEGNHEFALDGAVGGYLPDGRVNPEAKIIYVTEKNKGTTLWGNAVFQTDRGTTPNKRTPLIVRFLGKITGDDRLVGAGNGNITFEGIGPDALLYGWGLRTGGAHNIVIRNLNFDYWPNDAIELNGNNATRGSNYWVHNNSFGYGQNLYLATATDPDQAKGDGAVDITNHARNYTIAYNHFNGSSKVMLIGGGPTSISAHYGTIDHNWFEGSEERTPRVRNGRVHVFNNLYQNVQGHPYHDTLFDRNTGYGIGAAHNANVWAEGNIFDHVNFPFLRSRQGHARGFQPNDYGSDLPSGTPNAGYNHFFGDAPGFIVSYEAVTQGDFPETIEGFRKLTDVMPGITQEDLDSLREAALKLQPNVLDESSAKNFNVKEDVGIVVAHDSTTTNPNMTTNPAAQLDWKFRPSEQGVWPTGSAEQSKALRTEIESYSGAQHAPKAQEAPATPVISSVVINDEARSAVGAFIPAPGKIVVYQDTFTVNWMNTDVLTENYEIQWDQGSNEWKTLKTVKANGRPTSFITQDIDQFAHLKAILAKAEEGGAYSFRVRALNSAGASEWSDVYLVGELKVVDAAPSAVVHKQNGNQNELTVTVTETYQNRTTHEISDTFTIKNNAEGTYNVGGYKVFVNTKGNDQIRECYIVK